MLNFLKKILFGRTITPAECNEFACFLEQASSQTPKQKIIEYDKVYHHILKSLGYSGSFGEILKRNPKEIKNLNEVWELHKLRNRLVHDLKKPNVDLEGYSVKYKKVTDDFLRQMTKK